MRSWIFPTSIDRFRIHDWLACHDKVDFRQPKSIKEGDIVYLYCTMPEGRVVYQMLVGQINISNDDTIDDTAYALKPEILYANQEESSYCRLKLLKHVVSDKLTLRNFRSLGCNSCFQNAQKVPDNLLPFIEECFK